MTADPSPIIPELDGVPVDEDAEPLDADTPHDATVAEVVEAVEIDDEEGDR